MTLSQLQWLRNYVIIIINDKLESVKNVAVMAYFNVLT